MYQQKWEALLAASTAVLRPEGRMFTIQRRAERLTRIHALNTDEIKAFANCGEWTQVVVCCPHNRSWRPIGTHFC
jgi:hypothetical protein